MWVCVRGGVFQVFLFVVVVSLVGAESADDDETTLDVSISVQMNCLEDYTEIMKFFTECDRFAHKIVLIFILALLVLFVRLIFSVLLLNFIFVYFSTHFLVYFHGLNYPFRHISQ